MLQLCKLSNTGSKPTCLVLWTILKHDLTSHLVTARASDSVIYSDIALVISQRIIIIIHIKLVIALFVYLSALPVISFDLSMLLRIWHYGGLWRLPWGLSPRAIFLEISFRGQYFRRWLYAFVLNRLKVIKL